MTMTISCMERDKFKVPDGVLTLAVQQLLSALGLRMGLVARHPDRNGAAIFSASRNRGTGGSVVEIAVPYCSYEGRTVILSVVTGAGYKQKDIRWQRGGRPTVGSKAIAFFAATEECCIRWSSAMQDSFNEALSDLGFSNASGRVVTLRQHRNAMLQVRGASYELPSDDACEKANAALNGQCSACSAAELESLLPALDAGMQVVYATNADSMIAGDVFLLLSRKADLPQPAQVPKRRAKARTAAMAA